MKEISKIDRHKYLFEKFLRKENINTVEIGNNLGVSRKTIERDLKEEFDSIFKFPVEYLNGKWEIPDFIINTSSYSAGDLAVINSLLYKIEKDNPILHERAVDFFDVLNDKVSHVIYKQSSVEDIIGKYKKEFYLTEEAINNCFEIKFNYYYKDNPKHVQPLKVANLEKYWYLLCFDLDENKFWKYHFSGLKDILILEEKFDSKTHSYKDKLSNAINAYFNLETEYNIVLRITKEARKVLSRKELNSTQKIYKDTENVDKYILKITVSHLMEIVPLIQQWIPNIEVISPKEVKTIIRDNLKKFQI